MTEQAFWTQTEISGSYPQLQGSVDVDVVIVGGGITGLTTALLLQEAGKKVAIIESMQIGHGVSGYNSGHLTSLLLDMEYTSVIKNFGKDNARLAAQSQVEAIDLIEQWTARYGIQCDFRRIPGYLYAEKDSQVRELEDEFKAAQDVGLDVQLVDTTPLPFKTRKAVAIPHQARFHPANYVRALAIVFKDKGGLIFEQSPVHEVTPGNPGKVVSKTGEITADAIVLATHTPLGLKPLQQIQLEPLTSFIIGVRINTVPEDALYWDMDDPYHYMRLVEDEKGPFLIIGGSDVRTGEKHDTEANFVELEAYAREHYDVVSVDYRWSAELFDPADGLPYIGELGKESGLYIATGFSGEGLTGGTYAGQIISDKILGRANPWIELYDPNRLKPLAGAMGLLSENVGTMKHFIADRFAGESKSALSTLSAGEGKNLQCDGKPVAAYRDETGELHLMSAVCPHMKCTVQWNNSASSWDCPCHGARFDATGEVISGPAMQNLPALPVEIESRLLSETHS